MTIEQITGASAEELEGMTEAQLLEYFGPLLLITRPELAGGKTELAENKTKLSKAEAKMSPEERAKRDRLREKAKQLGFGDLI